jgi:hypothetical protein
VVKTIFQKPVDQYCQRLFRKEQVLLVFLVIIGPSNIFFSVLCEHLRKFNKEKLSDVLFLMDFPKTKKKQN